MASGNAPKGLEKAFEKVNQLLGQISDKTGKPLDVKGLTSTGKDLDSLSDGFRSIIRLLGDFEDLSDDVKLSFVDAESQKQIQQAINALQQYEKTAVEASKKVKELSAAQKEMSKSAKEVDKNKASVSNLTGRKGKKEAEVQGKRGQLEAINVEGANFEKIAKYRAELLKLEAELADIDRQLADANAALERSSSAYATSANSVAQLENELNQINQGSLEQLKQAAKEAGLSLEELDGKEASE
jgi:chromosome segregation ATPase